MTTTVNKKEYAVLALIAKEHEDDKLSEGFFVFEKRSKGIKQGGEICFPGGKVEEGEVFEETAVRETYEETGIDSGAIKLIKRLPVIEQPHRNIHPVLGTVSMNYIYSAVINPNEVDELFTVPIKFFKDNLPVVAYRSGDKEADKDFPYDAFGITSDYPWQTKSGRVIGWNYNGTIIWGLTALIVESLIKEIK